MVLRMSFACAALALLYGSHSQAIEVAQQSTPTFSRDVAPILSARCASCHRPAGAAPFSLQTFEDARVRARLIAEVTSRRVMPPWKPIAGGPFEGDRSLDAAQIDLIARWAAAGAPRGEDDAPAALAAAGEWPLGTPDLIVTLPVPYQLSAGGLDEFRNFVLPIPTTEMKYVAAVELNVSGSRVVHHANLRIDSTTGSRMRDAEDPLPGYEGAVSPNARYPDGYFLGWTPGQTAGRAAKGMAWRLRPGSDLVVQLHLRPSGSAESVQPRVAFYFTDEAPSRVPLAFRLGRQNLDIAPGTTYVAEDSYTLPVDVTIHAIHPHAHSRATDIKAFAVLPDGTRRTLLHIEDWDFAWQDVYRYREPVALPRGATIHSVFTYDNSSRNPRNPDSPPRRVLFGQRAADEMGDLWLQVLTNSTTERTLLNQDFFPKSLAEDVAGYEMVLRAHPDHAGYRRDLANGYYNLGTLHLTRGKHKEAATSFRLALTIRPNHSPSHNNLGVALKGLKLVDEAIAEFKRAIALDPANEGARQNLAAALAIKQ